MMSDNFVVMTRDEFDDSFRLICERIFSISPWPPAFVHQDWKKLLLPYGMNLEAQTLAALCKTALTCGDSELVAVTLETLPPYELSARFECSNESFRRAVDATMLGHFVTAVFGPSGKWGLLCHNPDDYAVLAGAEDVLSVFENTAGGEAGLRARFLEFASTEWQLDDRQQDAVRSEVKW